MAKYQAIVKKLGWKLASTPEQASHIVEADDESVDESSAPDYLRTVEKAQHENKKRVHWWYYPDSYNMWLSNEEVQGEDPEPEETHHGAWKVVSVVVG